MHRERISHKSPARGRQWPDGSAESPTSIHSVGVDCSTVRKPRLKGPTANSQALNSIDRKNPKNLCVRPEQHGHGPTAREAPPASPPHLRAPPCPPTAPPGGAAGPRRPALPPTCSGGPLLDSMAARAGSAMAGGGAPGDGGVKDRRMEWRGAGGAGGGGGGAAASTLQARPAPLPLLHHVSLVDDRHSLMGCARGCPGSTCISPVWLERCIYISLSLSSLSYHSLSRRCLGTDTLRGGGGGGVRGDTAALLPGLKLGDSVLSSTFLWAVLMHGSHPQISQAGWTIMLSYLIYVSLRQYNLTCGCYSCFSISLHFLVLLRLNFFDHISRTQLKQICGSTLLVQSSVVNEEAGSTLLDGPKPARD